ncbi:MAG: peptide chain release factor aRF-1 [Halobacteria archaeon]|nr:peptide chain release factor aRF-1 [Candidatus Bathyarchaeota archaeon]
MSERSSLSLFRLKRLLEVLASKEGRGTELISLYVPPGKQISDVTTYLRQEYSTASNIKSRTTRKNVLDAIEKVTNRIKLFKEPPPNGLVVFCGAIPKGSPGTEEIEIYVVIPPEPINTFIYRCDNRFHLEYLEEMLKEKETYGILVIDGSGATYATLKGKRLEFVREITSGVPSKHRAGGQSARRFERLREVELNEFYKRAGEYANKIFLGTPDLKGVLIGGPGPTKYDFTDGDYLHYELKKKILAVVDTAYIGEQGIREITERSSEILRSVRYIEERNLVQQFLYELGHDTGLAMYGEAEIRSALNKGLVKILLVSEELDVIRVAIKCTSCGYIEQKTIRHVDLVKLEQELVGKSCPKCSTPSLRIENVKDLIDELAEIAEQTGANLEVISAETEEGQMLLKSFGGMAAILRYKAESI